MILSRRNHGYMTTCYSLILLIVEYIKTYDMILGQSMSKKKAWVTGQIITTKFLPVKYGNSRIRRI